MDTSTKLFNKGFGIVPRYVLEDAQLSAGARLLFAYLCVLADEDGVCFPSQKYISFKLNMGLNTVKKYLNELKIRGYVNWTQSKVKGEFQPNIYYLVFDCVDNSVDNTENTLTAEQITVDQKMGYQNSDDRLPWYGNSATINTINKNTNNINTIDTNNRNIITSAKVGTKEKENPFLPLLKQHFSSSGLIKRFVRYIEHRSDIGKPMNEKLVKHHIAQLKGITQNEYMMMLIVKRATEKNWMNFYAIADNDNKDPVKGFIKELEESDSTSIA